MVLRSDSSMICSKATTAMIPSWVVLLLLIAGGPTLLQEGSSAAAAAAGSVVEGRTFDFNRTLRILVPRKVGFEEFATAKCPDGHNRSCVFSGFAVEVFETCITRIRQKRRVRYRMYACGDNLRDPSYDAMVKAVADGEADGVVGDLTINEKRAKIVDFTHPYIQSTLTMLVPYRYVSNSKKLWNFLDPFSAPLWGSIVASFLATGVAIFFLEPKNAHFYEQGQEWKTRLTNVFWFIFMTVFFVQGTEISTKLGRLVMFFWLLAILILASSYTASLSSMLGTSQSLPTIATFEDLSKSNLSMGCQDGSFTENYLENNLGIRPNRIQVAATPEEYEEDLKSCKVAAFIDELPYVQTFLNSRCDFTTTGPQIAYFGGFGFAFQKGSPLVNDLSLEILRLQEDGELQRIKNRWLGVSKCTQSLTQGQEITLQDFAGLFISLATLYVFFLILRVIGWIVEAFKHSKNQVTPII